MGMIRTGTIGFGDANEEVATIDSPEKLLVFARLHGIRTAPLDVRTLAEKLGIVFVSEKNMGDDISGILEKDENDLWTMRVNGKHHPNRIRYTIAHELGHFCLHRHQEKFFEDQIFFRGLERTKTEKQANRFASELLMPESLFQQYLDDGFTDIESLAKKFGVSTLALRIRAKDIGFTESEI